jgi:hypothetical protein
MFPQLHTNSPYAHVHNKLSKEFNIDNGSGTTDDDLVLHTTRPITIIRAQVVYTVATDTAGAASANVKIGTTAGGSGIVAATALQVSKAVGAKTSLTVVDGKVAADGNVWIRHTGIAATEAGNYKVLIEYTVDD